MPAVLFHTSQYCLRGLLGTNAGERVFCQHFIHFGPNNSIFAEDVGGYVAWNGNREVHSRLARLEKRSSVRRITAALVAAYTDEVG